MYETYVILVICLIIVRHVILTFTPWIVFSGYIFMFAIAFILSYVIKKSYYISLFIGLLVVYGRLIYRYLNPQAKTNYTSIQNTGLFIVGLIFIILLSHALKKPKALHLPIYFMVVYLFFSLIEWVLHRYIMHCYMYFPWLDKVQPNHTTIPFITYNMQKSCHLHHEHHKSVNPDMSLKDPDHRDSHELIFDWPTMIMTILLVIPLLFGVTYILRLHINWKIQIATVIIAAIIFCLAWNSIHPTMHGSHVKVAATEGAPNMGWNLDKDNIYYRNHDIHHQIKGDEKGNYNVIFLGADELLMTNKI